MKFIYFAQEGAILMTKYSRNKSKLKLFACKNASNMVTISHFSKNATKLDCFKSAPIKRGLESQTARHSKSQTIRYVETDLAKKLQTHINEL